MGRIDPISELLIAYALVVKGDRRLAQKLREERDMEATTERAADGRRYNERDYIDRTIATIRQHDRNALRESWWTGAALALADEVDRLRANDTVSVLHRLKRRIGRERARYGRIYDEKHERTGRHDERAFGEHNVCGIISGFVDEEIAKVRGAAS